MSTTAKGTTRCGKCMRVLDEAFDLDGRKPCPHCRSENRAYSEDIFETMELHDSLSWKQKRPGEKRPIAEGKSGDDKTRSTGRWAFLVRVLDRENNWYSEKVVEIDSGKVLRECNEPLTDHLNRGSAKPLPPKDT